MSGIRNKNTRPEVMIRKGLHARGFRFRLHSPTVPGKPDIVLPRYQAAVFVHGCFWHKHDCHLFKMPSTRGEFWRAKLEHNRQRDSEVHSAILESGWRLLVIWECALKGKFRLDSNELLNLASAWIKGKESTGEITGKPK